MRTSNANKISLNADFETIDFARLHGTSTILPRAAGSPMPPYPEREFGGWQELKVPVEVAAICRQLSRRGRHGVHVSAVGGPDFLAELDLLGVPFKVTDLSNRGRWGDPSWIVPDAIFRFAEDRAASD